MMVDLVENLFLVTVEGILCQVTYMLMLFIDHTGPQLVNYLYYSTSVHVNMFALPVAIAKPLKWSDC